MQMDNEPIIWEDAEDACLLRKAFRNEDDNAGPIAEVYLTADNERIKEDFAWEWTAYVTTDPEDPRFYRIAGSGFTKYKDEAQDLCEGVLNELGIITRQ